MKKINTTPSVKELKNFGWIFLGGFALIGGILYARQHPSIAMALWCVAVFVALVAFTLPSLARYFYIAWMALGVAIGAVMSRVVMSVIFYGVITPFSLFFKLRGKDSLKISPRNKTRPTYWEPQPDLSDPKTYDHLY